MNIAFPTVLIFLFILPGVVFHLHIYEQDELDYLSFTKKMTRCIIFSGIFHFIALFLLFQWSQVQFWELFVLLSGIADKRILLVIGQSFGSEWWKFFLYLLSSCLLPMFLAWGFKKIKWVEKYLMPDVYWIQVFKGSNCDYIMVTASVEMAKKEYRYEGLLEDFYLNKKSETLEYLVLIDVRRSVINDKNNHSTKEYADAAQCILKYSDIKSLSISFGRNISEST